ncbi:DNA-binding protein SMUBP-2 [Elasticomyces elasticus]|nr:DNA-binding protein SMUBP-2 [Elasticomyces elasticus]
MATLCAMMGFRVLLVSQSNKSVDTVFEGTRGIVQLSGQGNLLESHHSTFAASSKIFYDGKMIAGGDPARWNTALATKVHQLLSNQEFAGAYRNRNAAIDSENRQLLINNPGISEPEPNGMSYYNPNGVMATAIFVQMLVDSGVEATGIGIISMYSEDVRRIRQELAERGMEGVEVSTVDGYQGSEKEVMVVHFVAAFQDRQDLFAFVKRPQRLNVASTRARQYQFLVGNMDCWMHWLRNLPVSAPSTDNIRELMARER